MTEEPTPDEIRAVANAQVTKMQKIVFDLLIDAVDQIQTKPDTWQHEEVSLTARDLAEEALAVRGIAPQDVVFATARASGALIVALCKRVGLDPTALVKSSQENYARMSD